MATRENPYGAFNFLVKFQSIPGETTIYGGFSDVSGLGNEVKYSEYRNGNDKENHVRKIPGTYKVGDVTLKRGLVGQGELFAWIKDTRTQGYRAKRDISVMLMDEGRTGIVMTWRLLRAMPLKHSGPTLTGKGGARRQRFSEENLTNGKPCNR